MSWTVLVLLSTRPAQEFSSRHRRAKLTPTNVFELKRVRLLVEATERACDENMRSLRKRRVRAIRANKTTNSFNRDAQDG